MTKQILYVRFLFSSFVVGLTILFSLSFFWNLYLHQQFAVRFAKIAAVSNQDRVNLFFHWVSEQGGVYVPVSEQIHTNPYMINIPERDITTLSGQKLTLINPPVMIRQVFEISQKRNGIEGHVTSLNPLDHKNKPDQWEMEALRSFENGENEASVVQKIEGKDFLRLMKPLTFDNSCLKCHSPNEKSKFNSKGGISVSVPMDSYEQITISGFRNLLYSHLFIYFFIFIIAYFGYKRFLKEMKKSSDMQRLIIESEANLKKQYSEIQTLTEEYKSQNESLIRAIEKAEEGEVLKRAFLQNMSHEVRTPLNAITGFVALLENPDLSTKKRKSFSAIVNASCNQLVSIVTNILTISLLETNQEKPDLQKVNVNAIINDLVILIREQSFKPQISIKTKMQLSDSEAIVHTDQTKFIQILTNLLNNAVKFTHEGFVEVGYAVKNTVLEFYVKDTGIGIKPENQEKIFESFRQADSSLSREYGGTGLGLSISKGFVEMLGGQIWVESEQGEGAIFYFTIPYNQVVTSEPDNQILTFSGDKKNILVAEDEVFNYIFIQELLSDMGFDPICVKSGEEAIEICKTNQEINLVLMDIKMPTMDGHTAAGIIKSFRPELPIVAQSAYALEQDKEKYSNGVFDDYITKPINIKELRRVLKVFLD